MKRAVGVLLAAAWLMVPVVGCGEGRFYVTEEGAKVWEAPSEGWRVSGFGSWSTDLLERLVGRKPPEVDALRLYEKIVAEPGEWLGFVVMFGAVEKVVFTKNTRIVLIDKEGKRIESEACFFFPDKMQTQLYDTGKRSVVVTRRKVWCGAKNGGACGAAKFAAGRFRLKDIVAFEVVGAIEEAREGER